ncbi:MAG: hypothetical protein J6W06_11665 [Bacteroidales bacterium]|nr:hypothetical protein [Bacteroidales bacterium]
MQGCSSWSTTESISRGFACCHLGEKSTEYGDIKDTKVLLKSTGHTSATSIKHLSNFPGEDEVLASKKCMYKYIKEYMENSYLVIEVEPSI